MSARLRAARDAKDGLTFRWLKRAKGPNRAQRREAYALRMGKLRGLTKEQAKARIAQLLGVTP